MFKACLFALFPAFLMAQTVVFPQKWKFQKGDDAAFAAENFDEKGWREAAVPAQLEAVGWPDFSGIGWYRVRFSVPKRFENEDCVLLLGQIDDADEAFLNGQKVGATGLFPPAEPQSAWDQQRVYSIQKGLLKTENALAVRVWDGAGGGGIWAGRVEILTRKAYEKQLAERRKTGRSFSKLTTSNGLLAAVVDAPTGRVDAVWPHIFSAYDSAEFVEPFLQNLAPRTAEKPISARFLENTHVVEVRFPSFSIFYFSSFSAGDKVFRAIVRGPLEAIRGFKFDHDASKNLQETKFARSYFDNKLHEVIFLFSPKSEGQTWAALRRAEAARRSKTQPKKPAAEPKNDWPTVVAEPPSETVFEPSASPLFDLQKAEKFDTSPVETEVAWMKTEVFSRCRFSKNLTRKERAVFEQSVSILKMAQVAENEILPFARGQILASLRPGVWSISWVRDAVFAIEAITEIGLFDEARRGLEFMLRAQPTGQYRRFFDEKGQKEVGVGADYQISVTRYFGSGREESDFDERGPNIELDGFGLFLRAFSGYVEATGDAAFFEKWHDLVDSKIAFPILKNIDSSGLIRAESGPWEHHLPGRRWAWTAGASAFGLEKWAALEARFGRENEAAKAGGERLRKGFFEHLVVENRIVKGNAEDSKPTDRYFFDAAVFELFASGFLTEKSLFASHLAAAERVLGVKNKPAFIRINSSDSYENQEWPFAGLRVAVARARFGDRKGAKKLVDRVTDLASKNDGLIPEIVALDDEQFRGAVPMVGYGAGAWILARLAVGR